MASVGKARGVSSMWGAAAGFVAGVLTSAAGHRGWHDAEFGIKTFIASALAYASAISIGLDRPSWAVVTCFIVAQPLAGAVLSKAAFRLFGTVLGAAAAVALVPNLVNFPEALSVALASWIGLCTYLSLLDRTPRSYVFLLAGYSAAIIGFPAVTQPGAVFTLAALRVQEIGIGIVVSTVVHSLMFPRSVTVELTDRLDEMIADAEELTRSILSGTHGGDGGRADLVRDLAVLDALSVHLPYDLVRSSIRQGMLHALHRQLVEILALGSAVEDRLERLGERLPDEIGAILREVVLGFGSPMHDDLAKILIELRTAEPAIGRSVTFHGALVVSLLDRLSQLLAAHQACRDLRTTLYEPHHRLPPELGRLVKAAHRPGRHRDVRKALFGASAVMLATLVGCGAWIATAWTDGATGVVYAAMICALFANLDNPGPTTRNVLSGVLGATATAFVYRFGVVPRVTEFPVFMAVLAPAFFVISTLSQQPGRAGYALGAILAFPALVGIGDRYDPDFPAFANAAVAQIVGAWIAATALGIVRGVGVETRAASLVSAARLSLIRKLERRGRQANGWTAAMFDRIGLISALPGEMAPEVVDVMRMMRLGIAIDDLRRISAVRPADRRNLVGLERRVGRAVQRRGEHGRAQLYIRRMLSRVTRDSEGEDRRTALLALVALSCNLDPLDE